MVPRDGINRIYLRRTVSIGTLERIELLLRFEGSGPARREIWNDEVFLEVETEDDVRLVASRFGWLVDGVARVDEA